MPRPPLGPIPRCGPKRFVVVSLLRTEGRHVYSLFRPSPTPFVFSYSPQRLLSPGRPLVPRFASFIEEKGLLVHFFSVLVQTAFSFLTLAAPQEEVFFSPLFRWLADFSPHAAACSVVRCVTPEFFPLMVVACLTSFPAPFSYVFLS